MNYTKTQHSFRSSNGCDNTAYYIYTPKEKPKALIQLVHGMCEYIERYEHFIDHLCGMGYAVIGNDHLGHGNTAQDENDLGFFDLEHGWVRLVKDVRKLRLIGKSLFADIPHFFICHSMGTLIVRCYIAKYSGDTDGVIMMGLVSDHPMVDPMIILAESEAELHGVKSRSSKINKMLFGMSNARVEDKRTEFDWLSRDEQVVADYVGDKKCNFIFTASAFRDLFYMSSYCSRPSWYKQPDKDLPLLIMSGTGDPVGNYGKGASAFYKKLMKNGFADAELMLWDGARHELHNEINRLDVYKEITDWLEDKLTGEIS